MPHLPDAHREDLLPLNDGLVIAMADWALSTPPEEWIPPFPLMRLSLLMADSDTPASVMAEIEAETTILVAGGWVGDAGRTYDEVTRRLLESRHDFFMTSNAGKVQYGLELGRACVGPLAIQTALLRGKRLAQLKSLPPQEDAIIPTLPSSSEILTELEQEVHPALPKLLQDLAPKVETGIEETLVIGAYRAYKALDKDMQIQTLNRQLTE